MANKRKRASRTRKIDHLPELALSMIYARLSLVDKVRFSSVCKEWNAVSKNCSKMFRPNDIERVPWLMVEHSSTTFIKLPGNILSAKKVMEFNFAHADISPPAFFLCSKDGWLVYSKPADGTGYKESINRSYSVYLLNPISKSKIQMPCCNALTVHDASFTVVHGVPRLVVLLISRKLDPYKPYNHRNMVFPVLVANLGDNGWNEYQHHRSRLLGSVMTRMTMFRNRFVVCNILGHGDHGNILYFDLSERVWVESRVKTTGSTCICNDFAYVEFEGKLMRFHCKLPHDCYEVDLEKFTSVKLENEGLKGVCFYCDGTRVLMARDTTGKIYNFRDMRAPYIWGYELGELRRCGANDDRLLKRLSKLQGRVYFVDLG